jgi:hypothetical protein
MIRQRARMGDRTCGKCGHRFKYPSGLRKHITQRKTPCVRAAGTQASELQRPPRELARPASEPPQMDESTKLLYAKLLQMEEQLARLKLQPTFIQQNNFVNKVTLNYFGREGTDHITPKHVMHMLDNAVSQGAADALFAEAAMLIYSDYEHPENITAYLPNCGGNDRVMIYQEEPEGAGPAWCSVPLDQATPPMVKKTIDLLMDQQPFESGQNTLEEYGKMLQAVFKREDEYAQMTGRQQLRTVLVRNREFIMSR